MLNENFKVITDPVIGRAVSTRELHEKVMSKAHYQTWLKGRMQDLALVEGTDVQHRGGPKRDAYVTIVAAIKIAATHYRSFPALEQELEAVLKSAKLSLVTMVKVLEQRTLFHDSALLKHLQAISIRENGSASKEEKLLQIAVLKEKWEQDSRNADKVQENWLVSLRRQVTDLDALHRTKKETKNAPHSI